MSLDRHFAAPRVVDAVYLAALVLPAVSVVGVLEDRTTLALLSIVASSTLYAVGYLIAQRRESRLRGQLAGAVRDPLTGLLTRAAAYDVLATATAGRIRLTVALADVDGLRAVNNNFGHAAGDQYLTAVADRLTRATPVGGRVVRLGGDELVILAPDADPADLAAAIGAAMSGAALVAGRWMRLRASIGIAPSGGGDARHALARADAAMYSAKAAGGNHALTFDVARDGEPQPDGTRPAVRRRDLSPTGSAGCQPTRGEDLLPLLWSETDVRTIQQALNLARDRPARAARAGDDLDIAAPAPAAACKPAPDRKNSKPTSNGDRAITHISVREQAEYARLAHSLADVIAVTGSGATRPGRAE
jgi:diguanylate cyclase (GGDEF)-like protein